MHRIRRISYDGKIMWEKGMEPSAKRVSNEDLGSDFDRDLDQHNCASAPVDFALHSGARSNLLMASTMTSERLNVKGPYTIHNIACQPVIQIRT